MTRTANEQPSRGVNAVARSNRDRCAPIVLAERRNKKQPWHRRAAGPVGALEEIARAIVFLASDKASFVTGQILAADGGKIAG